ncbi:hypothetical protein MXEN_00790 [Mycobacterium xenopi RIVM700367]|nr:hypothetical protein MXEN_00790 [Mycobacterium xenopi RIVM700367]
MRPSTDLLQNPAGLNEGMALGDVSDSPDPMRDRVERRSSPPIRAHALSDQPGASTDTRSPRLQNQISHGRTGLRLP